MKEDFVLFPETLLLISKKEAIEESDILEKGKILVLSLLNTKYRWIELFGEEFTSKVSFFPTYEKLGLDPGEVSQHLANIKAWGVTLRDPESLKYFSQFKETLKEVFEDLVPEIKLVDQEKRDKKAEILQAVLTLELAEELDQEVSGIWKSLQSVDQKYQSIFKSRIIGEDYTFEEFEAPFKVDIPIHTNLEGISARISAWKVIAPILFKDFNDKVRVLVTEKEIVEMWENPEEELAKLFAKKEVDLRTIEVND